MIDRKKFMLTWWDKTKLVIGVVCLLFVWVQLSAASKMITENNTEVRMITPQEYVGLNFGDEVAAEVKKEDMLIRFIGSSDTMSYYLVRVSDDHAVIMRPLLGSACDGAMGEMLHGKRDSITYKGRVNIVPETDMAELNLVILSGDELYKRGMSRHVNDVILKYSIDITLYDAMAHTKYIIATIVGAIVMLAAAVWAFWKPFKKLGYRYAVMFGKVELDLIKKEDLPVEQGWFTGDGDKVDIDSLPDRPIDENFEKVDFYESGVNQEGNFYVETKDEPEPPPDINGFSHKHKNY